jgi:integrase
MSTAATWIRGPAWRLILARMPGGNAASGHVQLRRGARGGVFYLKYRLPDGRQLQHRLGPEWRDTGRPPAGYYTKKSAEAALREVLADAQRGRLPGQVRSGATFADAVDEWLRYIEHDRQRAQSTLADYRSTVNHSFLPEFGADTPLEAITMEGIDDYRARMQREGRLSNRTIAKQLVMLGGIFKRAQRVWNLPSNPALGVERPPVHRTGEFEVLTPIEVNMLAAAAESERDAALFVTAAFTGLRMGELRALRWADVDFGKRLVHVRKAFTRTTLGSPKSYKVRSVPMIDQVAQVLADLSMRDEFVGPDDLVFPNSIGNFLDDSKLRYRFKKALERAGLKRIRFHDLRHTFGTLAVQVFPISDVKAYMGHADIQTTMIYVHHVPQHDAADKLSRAIREASEYVDMRLEPSD